MGQRVRVTVARRCTGAERWHVVEVKVGDDSVTAPAAIVCVTRVRVTLTAV